MGFFLFLSWFLISFHLFVVILWLWILLGLRVCENSFVYKNSWKRSTCPTMLSERILTLLLLREIQRRRQKSTVTANVHLNKFKLLNYPLFLSEKVVPDLTWLTISPKVCWINWSQRMGKSSLAKVVFKVFPYTY